MDVAPFTGAWIEIEGLHKPSNLVWVAPFTGAWIEIGLVPSTGQVLKSLPSRERGLKLRTGLYLGAVDRRSLHGSVD